MKRTNREYDTYFTKLWIVIAEEMGMVVIMFVRLYLCKIVNNWRVNSRKETETQTESHYNVCIFLVIYINDLLVHPPPDDAVVYFLQFFSYSGVYCIDTSLCVIFNDEVSISVYLIIYYFLFTKLNFKSAP